MAAPIITPPNADPLAWLDKYADEARRNFEAAGLTVDDINTASEYSELDEIEDAA